MRLAAIECFRRGLSILRANGELVLCQWLRGLAATALTVMGVALPLLALGYDLESSDVLGNPDRLLPDLLPRAQERLGSLGVALLGSSLLWLLALGVHCYVQAGTYGTLAAADRQMTATAGSAAPGAPAAAARAFTWRGFAAWAGRYQGRFFAFVNFACGVLLVWTLGLVAWMAAMLGGAARWGAEAAAGIGCGGALPIAFLLLGFGLWYGVAQAALLPATGTLAAARTGLAIVRRRSGAVVGLTGLYLATFLAALGASSLAALAVDLVLHRLPALRSALNVALTLISTCAVSLLSVAFGGALVALVHSEDRVAA